MWRKLLVRGIYRGGRDDAEIIEPDIGVDTVTARGSYVIDVWEDGPADDDLNLRTGDIILEVGGRLTHRAGEMSDALTKLHPGLPAPILYLSRGTLKLDEVTADRVLLDEYGGRYPERAVHRFKIPLLIEVRNKQAHGRSYSSVAVGNLLFFHLFRYREGPGKTGIEILSIPFDWLL